MVLHDMTEKELIELASKGDRQAFCSLVSIHRTKLRSFALGIACGNAHLADDILQEALIKAYLAMKNYELRSSFTTWLWRIIKNEFINYIRDPAVKIEMSSDSEDDTGVALKSDDSPESELIKEDVKREVHELINALPVKLRMAIVLIDIQEMPYEEAAQILEISLTALKSRVFKGRKKMVELLNEKKDIKQLSFADNRQKEVKGAGE